MQHMYTVLYNDPAAAEQNRTICVMVLDKVLGPSLPVLIPDLEE